MEREKLIAIVQRQYPEASAEYRDPASYEPGHWAVLRSGELGCDRLGTGDTEYEAWQDAASRIDEI